MPLQKIINHVSDAGVAQQEVRLTCNQQGVGSTPTTGSTIIFRGGEYMKVNENGFLMCPECAKKTKTKVIPNVTKIRDFPLYCPWCKRETIINY